ncbi:cupredoxin domain-containing protein [Streptomyces griseocarneus]|uniref:cupredoxin domain-containing protein n=1 Tax=Streptomyces griseocarneus TaxID=51201 RepID=UPI001992F49A|nr:cupredoxin domain-containing protein [Streptomyces griseocarneus]MBZ6477766.1 cupredoxin domain-containing protein [Streptomyces griseocarneus]GHG61189.1 hypothetical protein GCM10018779_28770 [Streptomyces griseocarneus]
MSRSMSHPTSRSSFRLALRVLTALLAALFAGALAAGPVAAAPRAAATTTVVIEGSPAVFVPRTVTVRAGDTVRWINNDNDTHTTTSDTDLWDAVLDPGQSFSRTFPAAGTFSYHCAIHPEMTGTVIVQ